MCLPLKGAERQRVFLERVPSSAGSELIALFSLLRGCRASLCGEADARAVVAWSAGCAACEGLGVGDRCTRWPEGLESGWPGINTTAGSAQSLYCRIWELERSGGRRNVEWGGGMDSDPAW